MKTPEKLKKKRKNLVNKNTFKHINYIYIIYNFIIIYLILSLYDIFINILNIITIYICVCVLILLTKQKRKIKTILE